MEQAEQKCVEISVVIPVYKAQDCLHELYNRLIAALEAITTSFEIILIEDCGGDLSWDIIKQLCEKDQRVLGVQFSRNFGQHAGIFAGLDLCHGQWAVIMDCDLQDRPEDINLLFLKAKEGYDVVLSSMKTRQHGAMKNLWAKAFYCVFEFFLESKVDGSIGSFTILSRKVINSLRNMKEQNRSYSSLVYFRWLGFRTTCIKVEHAKRFAGHSSYSMSRLFKLAINSIISYSNKPLRLSIWFGFIIASTALLFAVYLVYKYLTQGIGVEGWTTVVVSIWLLAGLGFMNMGIIGLYIGKIFDETKQRPIYVISEKVNLK